MPRKPGGGATRNPHRRTGTKTLPKTRSFSTPQTIGNVRRNKSDQGPETTVIVLRIAADHATDFEAMFEAEELPIWDAFTRRGRFLEARLVRAIGGSEQRGGIQDYLLHIVAADHEAHEEHDRDPRFRAFLAKAERFQPEAPLVWFGDIIFERGR
jgi:hypothetical protein